jgi:hypothetical protein
MSSAAAHGNPSALLQPNPHERVEKAVIPAYEDDKHAHADANMTPGGHGDQFSAGAILRGDAGHTMPVTPFEMKAALVNA